MIVSYHPLVIIFTVMTILLAEIMQAILLNACSFLCECEAKIVRQHTSEVT
eukprot:UN00110